MQEIRVLAKQIRQKKQLLVMESREKNVHGPRMPRTASKVRGATPSLFELTVCNYIFVFCDVGIAEIPVFDVFRLIRRSWRRRWASLAWRCRATIT